MNPIRGELNRVMRIHFMETLGNRDGQGWACYYCKTELRPYGENGHSNSPAIEHRQPVSRGGTNELSNLVLTCANCNRMKGAQTEIEFKKRHMPLNEYLTEKLIGICAFLDIELPKMMSEKAGYQIEWTPLVESIRKSKGDDTWPLSLVNEAVKEHGKKPVSRLFFGGPPAPPSVQAADQLDSRIAMERKNRLKGADW